jgi:hypothetical protein
MMMTIINKPFEVMQGWLPSDGVIGFLTPQVELMMTTSLLSFFIWLARAIF